VIDRLGLSYMNSQGCEKCNEIVKFALCRLNQQPRIPETSGERLEAGGHAGNVASDYRMGRRDPSSLEASDDNFLQWIPLIM
jgi:hypothetical protein